MFPDRVSLRDSSVKLDLCSRLSLDLTMELWVQLRQAGLEGLGLGPPPQALRMPPPEGNPGQTLMSSGTELGGTRERLLWIWEELGNLRRVDVQLLGQLCHLGLEMGAFREELATILEEEEEGCVGEEDGEPQGKQEEGHPEASYPALSLPDFEMTI
ncbi:glutamate-rich protein 4-like [Phodopus roborovskii]|uniref:glutamate-rich protein 4-like n=1 Tax=Phodopus roborovskii TaxID=109678 RepID=UPI0021E455EA|nr:glutamate-rich protein 4-like [Phodopus roborovskii]